MAGHLTFEEALNKRLQQFCGLYRVGRGRGRNGKVLDAELRSRKVSAFCILPSNEASGAARKMFAYCFRYLDLGMKAP